MNISAIHNNNVLKTFGTQEKNTNTSDFKSIFQESLSKLNDSQIIVAQKQKELINGEIEAYELSAAVAESELALKLATSISGKLVSAMQEITNLQI